MFRELKISFIAVSALAAAGCASPSKVFINSKFDTGEANNLLAAGKNTVKGSALIRQMAGGVVTCAGLPVTLIPATAYADERLPKTFVPRTFMVNDSGFMSFRIADSYPAPIFIPDEPQYPQLTRNSICDAQGFFKFDQLADGSFYIWTTVQWYVDKDKQGGVLLKRVSVKNGETKEIVLAP